MQTHERPGHHCGRLWLCAMFVLSFATSVAAQQGEDHAAHHGGGPGGAAMSTGVPAPASTIAAAAGMAGMMEGMANEEGEGEHGGRRQAFFANLLALPALDEPARRAVAAQARDRVGTGLALINAALTDAQHATTITNRLDAARRLRAGTDLFRSGTAAQGAIGGLQPPQEVALDWFREQLTPGQQSPDHVDHPFGLSPSHLLLMLFLTLVSATLIALQLFRLAKIRALVGKPTSVTDPGASEKANPTSRRDAIPSAAAVPAAGLAATRPLELLAPTSARLAKGWSGQLQIVQIVRETPTVVTFRLADPSGNQLPFDYLPGQFLQVEVTTLDGKSARRSYTIASSPTQRAHVELTVKREEQGAVSRYLHDTAVTGDLLKASGPFGKFTFTGTDANSIVLIAGGVGITPMMSVLRYLTDMSWNGEIFFIYGARSTEEFIFREEIERLERRFSNVHVFAAMQRAPGTVWLGPEGNITKDMILAAVPDIAKRRIHLCGPPGMMGAMRAQLTDLGVPEAQMHTEAFGPASLPADAETLEVMPAPPPRQATTSTPPVAPGTVTFSLSGVSAALPENETVLEAAEGAGVEIPYACRVGQCGVCVVKLLSGEVTMAVETGLAPADKSQGYVLACQAKGTGTALVVEA